MSTKLPASSREPFLDSASFHSMLAFRTNDAIPDLISAIETEDIDPEDLGHVRQQLFGHRFAVTLLLYSGGRPMDELRPALEAALNRPWPRP